MLVEHLDHPHGLEPLEPFDQLPQQLEPFLLALLAQDDERRRRVRHPRLERRQQRIRTSASRTRPRELQVA